MRLYAVFLLVAIWSNERFEAQTQAPGESSSSRNRRNSSTRVAPDIGDGTVANGVYRNRALGLSCKTPAGWVLRTEEMNSREEEPGSASTEPKSSPQGS